MKNYIAILIMVLLVNIATAQSSKGNIISPTQIENTVIERTKAGVAQVFAGNSSGSGFFVDIKGYIFAITNFHVIEKLEQEIESGNKAAIGTIRVRTAFGNETRATVWKKSRTYDIAILKLEQTPITVVPLEISKLTPHPGMEVFLWGAPRGINLVPLDGAISELGRNSNASLFAGEPVSIIFARISVAPGNSGGPLLDRQGNVIGVISARQSSINNIHTGISIAISADQFSSIIQSFNPRETDQFKFPDRKPKDSPPPRDTPAFPLPPQQQNPKSTSSDFALGESQALNYDCIQRLSIPGSAGVRGYTLARPGNTRFLEFPLGANRIRSVRMLGTQTIELTVEISRDGGDTFLCILK